MQKSENIANLAAALVKAQSAMGNASKDAKNPFFKSKYADLNAIREAVLPALNANNISVLQLTGQDQGKDVVMTTLMHSSGEYIVSTTPIVCAKQNDPQALGSAISYARRYGLQAMLCVGAEDDDGNAGSGKATMTTGLLTVQSNSPKLNEASPATTVIVTNTQVDAAQSRNVTPSQGFVKATKKVDKSGLDF